jgi:hypothetical protein
MSQSKKRAMKQIGRDIMGVEGTDRHEHREILKNPENVVMLESLGRNRKWWMEMNLDRRARRKQRSASVQ